MNIGEAAGASGISTKMIRYYESTGLIDPADRTAAGYRVYTRSDIHTLRFIRRARDLGFSVSQIENLLALWHNSDRASADVKTLALKHVTQLSEKVGELKTMIAALKHLASTCDGDDRPDCPILRDLAEGDHIAFSVPVDSRFGVSRIN